MKNTLDIDTDHDRLDFKPVTKADIPLLMKYFTRFPSRSCDFSIGGTLMWSDFYGYRYAVCGDTLFIKDTILLPEETYITNHQDAFLRKYG